MVRGLRLISILLIFSVIVFASDNPSFPYIDQDPPGETPILFAPGIISTPEANIHSTITFTPDLNEAYFARLYGQPRNGVKSEIYVVKCINNTWQKPEPLKLTGDDFSPMLSTDGNQLFYATHWRLAKLTRNDDGWSEPIDLGDVINFQKRQDGPCVTSDGTLYFTSMFGANNGLFYARLINDTYGSPQKINTGHEGRPADGYAYIAHDESYIIFMSWRPGGYGKFDLYVIFKFDNGDWSDAINLGPKINSDEQESFPSVSPDGKYLFFNSNRTSELTTSVPGHFYGNVYWVSAEVVFSLKPE